MEGQNVRIAGAPKSAASAGGNWWPALIDLAALATIVVGALGGLPSSPSRHRLHFDQRPCIPRVL